MTNTEIESINLHIIILNYNGIMLLRKYLSSIIMAAENSSYRTKITILDNNSTDGSCEYIKENFKKINLSISPKNLLLASYNNFLKTINERFVFLLNNDIRLSPDCIDYLMPHFTNRSVFCVAPKVMDIEGKKITGGYMDFSFRAGIFRNKLKSQNSNNFTLFIGSSAIYDKEKFQKLGGYDPLYLPGTYEDIDLCYRAWQRGWYCIYEKKAIVYHQDSASFSKRFGNYRRQRISARNAYIFIWKNIRDYKIITQNILCYPLNISLNLLRLRFDLVAGYLEALLFLPKVIKKRSETKKYIYRSEDEICRLVQKI